MKPKLLYATAALAATSFAAQWKVADNPLTTPWTAKVTAEHAWSEYPRPQMARSEWTNLNGLWDYAIVGKDAARPTVFEGQILAPFAVESALSGVKRALQPDQRLWYRRTFNVRNGKGKRVLLHFEAVDWRAEVSLNGIALGTHEGGYDPFSFDITGALKNKGPQELVVSVWDPTDTGLQPRGKQVLNPQGIWYTAVSGIWQTVWLETVPEQHIEALKMIPDVDNKKLRLTVLTPESITFTAEARLNGKSAGQLMAKTNEETELALTEVRTWSPDSPVLYDLVIKLNTGDTVRSYFGMRKVAMQKDAKGYNRIFLNGAPLFEIGPLDQGWWPDGLYTAPTDEALRSDIEQLKKMGFNMCRKHVKVEPRRFYYWCDKLGFLVWQDLPSAMTKDVTTRVKRNGEEASFPADADRQFRRELKAMIDGHINQPSIVAWVPFNEGWGQHATNEILKMTKDLDPSRLVDAPSGWEDRGWGDFKDMHNYPGPGMHPVMSDRISVLGEFGGLGIPIEGHLWWNKRNWGYRTFEDREKLQAGYEGLMEKLLPLAEQGLAAAVYTQTTDVEGEVNGLMTYDRKMIKYDPAKLAEWHRKIIAAGSPKQ